jgi:preprotein translocase subunit YajC
VSNLLVNLEPTSPKAGATQEGVAQGAPAGGPPPGPSLLMSFAPLLILIPFLWLSSRRTKKEADERAKLAKGDRVLVSGGLLGEIVEKGEKTARVKIAQGVVVEVVTSTLSPLGTGEGAK